MPVVKQLVALGVSLVLASAGMAQQGNVYQVPVTRYNIGVDQKKLGTQIPGDITFTDDHGKPVKLGDYYGKKPIVLIPIWYRCTGICLVELEGVLKAFKGQKKLKIGEDFIPITFSLHPKEDTTYARNKKVLVIDALRDPKAAKGWPFLTGSEQSIRRLTDAIGYKFQYYPERDAIDHPACIVILTPSGKIAQYFIDVVYQPKRVHDAIVAASTEKIGREMEARWFGCVMFDPTTGQYTLNVIRTLQVVGTGTVVLMIAWIVGMSLRNRNRSRTPGGAKA